MKAVTIHASAQKNQSNSIWLSPFCYTMHIFTDKSVDTHWYKDAITKIVECEYILAKKQTEINIPGNNTVKSWSKNVK